VPWEPQDSITTYASQWSGTDGWDGVLTAEHLTEAAQTERRPQSVPRSGIDRDG